MNNLDSILYTNKQEQFCVRISHPSFCTCLTLPELLCAFKKSKFIYFRRASLPYMGKRENYSRYNCQSIQRHSERAAGKWRRVECMQVMNTACDVHEISSILHATVWNWILGPRPPSWFWLMSYYVLHESKKKKKNHISLGFMDLWSTQPQSSMLTGQNIPNYDSNSHQYHHILP